MSKTLSHELVQKKGADHNHLALIRLWYVDSQNIILIEITSEQILKDPTIKEINASEISILVGINERDAEIALNLLSDIGGLFGSSSVKSNVYGCQQGRFPNNDSSYKEFLEFKNLDYVMERYFVELRYRSKIRKSSIIDNTHTQNTKNIFNYTSSTDIWGESAIGKHS